MNEKETRIISDENKEIIRGFNWSSSAPQHSGLKTYTAYVPNGVDSSKLRAALEESGVTLYRASPDFAYAKVGLGVAAVSSNISAGEKRICIKAEDMNFLTKKIPDLKVHEMKNFNASRQQWGAAI